MTKRHKPSRTVARTLATEYAQPPLSREPIESAPILKKLLSTETDDIAWASAAISNLVSNKETLSILIENNVIGHLSSAMTLPNPEIQTELIGALRNIAVYGTQEICKEMHHKSVLTNLIQLIPNIADTIHSVIEERVTPEQQGQCMIQSNLAEQTFYLMSHLAEQYNPSLKELEQTALLASLVRCLLFAPKFPLSLILSVGQLLLSLTESSKISLQYFRNNKNLVKDLITLIKQKGTWKDKTINIPLIGAGVLYNIRHMFISKSTKLELKELLDAVQGVSVECCDLDLTLAIKQGLAASNSRLVSMEVADEDKYIAECEDVMETLLVALELLTNVYSDSNDDVKEKRVQEPQSDDEDMELNEEEPPELDSEEEAAEAILHQESGVHRNDDNDDEASNDGEDNFEESDEDNAFEMMQNDPMHDETNIIDGDNPEAIDTLLMQLIQIADIKIESQQPASAKNIISLLYSIKTCTFGALGNVCLKSKKSWIKSHYSQLWAWILQHATQDSQQDIQFDDRTLLDGAFKTDLIESIIGVMLVLIDRAAFVDSTMIVSCEQSVVLLMAAVMNVNASESLRSNCVRILSQLARKQEQLPVNKVIGESLVKLVENVSTSVLLIAECLDALFDVYGDENFDYDCNFRQGMFLEKLKVVKKRLLSKVKLLDKRKNRDIREQADIAMTNLKAFLVYKETEYRKLGFL